MRIQLLPSFDQPRNKLEKKGAHALTNDELVATVIGTGIKGKNVIQIAKNLLRRFPIYTWLTLSLSQLQEVKGIGRTKASQIIALIELVHRIQNTNQQISIITPEDVWKQLEPTRGKKKEYFTAFYLDVRNNVIARETISIGTLNASLVHPREVFEPAVRYIAAQVILAHNHPSTFVEPSEEDLALTKRLQDAGKILGIHIIDHIIVTEKNWYSFLQHNLL